MSKRGPTRTCDCGKCRLCKQRARGAAHYQRNASALSRKNYYRYTLPRRKKLASDPTDDDLDAKAMAWLEAMDAH